MRDITLEDTIYVKFTTRSFSTGAPATLGGTPDLSVYEQNNLTQITAGVTVSTDYDSITGLNQATVVASTANGYESGKSYDLIITAGTVGGVSVVGEVIESFTIGSSAAAILIGHAGVGLTHLAESSICTETRLSELDSANIPSDLDAVLVDTNSLNGTKIPQTLNLTASGNIGIDWSNVENANTTVNLVGTTVSLVTTTTTNTDMRGTDNAALASDYTSARAGYIDNINGHIAQTGDNFPRIGHAGVGLTHLATSVNLATVDTIVDSILALLDDPRSEPGQGELAVNADAMTKLDYLYKFMRNKVVTNSTSIKVWDDAGTTVDHMCTISSVGSTFNRGEFGTGA